MQIFNNIKRFIRWFPIIWNDREFDYNYLLEVMKFKLEEMENFFRSKNAMSMYSEQRADEMRRCITTLDRMIKNDYSAFDRHDKKWGEMKMDFKAANDEFDEFDELSEMVITRPFVFNEFLGKQERKEFMRCAEHEDMLVKQDMEYLFNQIKKHLKGWWD